MQDSIFTKIIQGDIPSEKIYEDDLTIAFLTVEPIQPGHTLVVSKKQVDQIWDLEDEDYLAVWDSARKVAKRIKDALGVERVGVKVEGLEVPHVHVHLIPFNTVEQYNSPAKLGSPQDLAEMAKKLAIQP
jgi:histidine triad (HIT) family protein